MWFQCRSAQGGTGVVDVRYVRVGKGRRRGTGADEPEIIFVVGCIRIVSPSNAGVLAADNARHRGVPSLSRHLEPGTRTANRNPRWIVQRVSGEQGWRLVLLLVNSTLRNCEIDTVVGVATSARFVRTFKLAIVVHPPWHCRVR